MSNNNTAQASKKYDLIITRVFDAPIQLVWKSSIDPKRMAQWWGPKDFTNPVC
jgi:uncharacterized protein YndB with AHSA1/START domain